MTIIYSGKDVTTYTIENLGGALFNADFFGEYIQYTLPVSVKITSYSIQFDTDSKPVAWSILAKTKQGYWIRLDDKEFVNEEDQFTLDLNFPTEFYDGQIGIPYTSDVVRLHIRASTGTSVKIKNFKIFDDKGIHRNFLVPFCTTTNGHGHTGSLNFSHVDSCSLTADLTTDFFALSHNMIVIENGMADTIFK